MEKIAFIVDRLNMPPFSKGFNTMSEFDSKSSLELLDICSEIIAAIDPDQADLMHDVTENRVRRIVQFLIVMKFNIPEDQVEDFTNILMSGDKDLFNTIAHWCLQRFEALQKRAYLAKFLMPIDIPPEFMSDELVLDLSAHLKELQAEFKTVHKAADKIQSSGARPAELKAEIAQLEQEHTQLQNKIKKMKKEAAGDEAYFQEMLKVTSALRKEQEEEVRIHERMREHRHTLNEADQHSVDANRRLTSLRQSGAQNQTAEQLLSKLQKDVRELADRKDTLESTFTERERLLEKLQGFDGSERMTTEDDVRAKREQVSDIREQVSVLEQRLEAALEKNTKLTVFRQASTMALKKLRDREEEIERLNDERRKLLKQIDDKEHQLQAMGRDSSSKIGKRDLKKYGAQVRDKIEVYKKMREEIAALRAELATLQRTEQILKSKHQHLDAFLTELERKRGVEGYRETQRQLIEMTEKTAGVDQVKGATLEQISQMVEEINREYKKKSSQLQPLMQELRALRQEFTDTEGDYNERKGNFDKVAVGLELEKQSLEKECDDCQEECLREESRYHYLNSLVSQARIRLERAEQEKKWQDKDGRMMRDFASFKELYAHKITQQEQLIKQLRKKQKELKENSEAMSNQKSNFNSLQALLKLKLGEGGGTSGVVIRSAGFGSGPRGSGGDNFESITF